MRTEDVAHSPTVPGPASATHAHYTYTVMSSSSLIEAVTVATEM